MPATKPSYASITLNPLRTHHTFRIALIAVMLLGWLALSQRCALAQMLRANQAAAVQHECCEKSGSPDGGVPKDGRSAECCQALSVVVPDGAKVPEVSIADSLFVPVAWMVAALESRPPDLVAEAKADPPPELLGFTELVLHRSLRSHAPPLLA